MLFHNVVVRTYSNVAFENKMVEFVSMFNIASCESYIIIFLEEKLILNDLHSYLHIFTVHMFFIGKNKQKTWKICTIQFLELFIDMEMG